MTQQKKNIGLLISLVVLTAITAGVYFTDAGVRRGTATNLFAVDGLEEVDQVILSSAEQRVSLRMIGGRWTVNDEGYANDRRVTILMAVIAQTRSQRPVAEARRDEVLKLLGEKGVTVELIKGNEIVKKIITGGDPERNESYFMDPEERTPYLVAIPGYREAVYPVFELPAYAWRSTRIFDFNWSNFSRLTATFPGSTEKDFVMEMDRRGVILSGIAEPDTARLNTFLDAVSLVTVSEYLPPSQSLVDSLLSVDPRMIIQVRDIAGKTYTLNLYGEMPRSAGSVVLLDSVRGGIIGPGNVDELVREREYFSPVSSPSH